MTDTPLAPPPASAEDAPAGAPPPRPTKFRSPEALDRLAKRRAAERRFKRYGQAAIFVALSMLALLLVSIVTQALSAFQEHMISFEVEASALPERGAASSTSRVNATYIVLRDDIEASLPGAEGRAARRDAGSLLNRLAAVRLADREDLPATGTVTYRAPLSADADLYLKGRAGGELARPLALERLVPAADGESLLTVEDAEGVFAFLDAAGAVQDGRLRSEASILVQVGDSVGQLVDIVPAGGSAQLQVSPYAGRFEDAGQPTTLRVLADATERNITDRQAAFARSLQAQGRIEQAFIWDILAVTDSTYPELAGLAAAIVGSFLTMAITALVALPVGVAASIYLEEFAPTNRLTNLIEVNINNLAAVPSIIFGLLGLALFINFAGMPRGAPVVGGLVLALQTLPTIIIASRAALRSVPPSIRSAALGVGASKVQAIFHHVLPLAAPGILTGAIIGLARALGETAPLLLIGMVAFVAEIPSSPTDSATTLPVLIYNWSTRVERAWEPLTALAIIVLLVFMIAMNALAVFLRRSFERRW